SNSHDSLTFLHCPAPVDSASSSSLPSTGAEFTGLNLLQVIWLTLAVKYSGLICRRKPTRVKKTQ
ncbi:MAG: hypothetical protein ACK559_05895, partial [bacterium]